MWFKNLCLAVEPQLQSEPDKRGPLWLWQAFCPACSAFLSSLVWGKGLKSWDYIHSKAISPTYYKSNLEPFNCHLSEVEFLFLYWYRLCQQQQRAFWRTLVISSNLRRVSYKLKENKYKELRKMRIQPLSAVFQITVGTAWPDGPWGECHPLILREGQSEDRGYADGEGANVAWLASHS